MTDERWDISLFESGEEPKPEDHQKVTMPLQAVSLAGPSSSLVLDSGPSESSETLQVHGAEDVHSKVTTPVNVSQMFGGASSSMGLAESSVDEVLSQVVGVLGLSDVSGSIPVMSVNHSDRCMMWGVGISDDKIQRVGWVRQGLLKFADVEQDEYSVQLNGLEVSALHCGADITLMGFAHGELFYLDHKAQMMGGLYAQEHSVPIIALCYFESYRSCFFVNAEGQVFVCKSIGEGNQIRKIKRRIHAGTRHLLYNKMTRDFAWFAPEALYSGDLKGEPHRVMAIQKPALARFSPDGTLLYVLTQDNVLEVYRWDVEPQLVYEKRLFSHVVALTVSHDCECLGLIVQGTDVILEHF